MTAVDESGTESGVVDASPRVLQGLESALREYISKEIRFASKRPGIFDELAYIKFWAQLQMTQLRSEAQAYVEEHAKAAHETGVHEDTR